MIRTLTSLSNFSLCDSHPTQRRRLDILFNFSDIAFCHQNFYSCASKSNVGIWRKKRLSNK